MIPNAFEDAATSRPFNIEEVGPHGNVFNASPTPALIFDFDDKKALNDAVSVTSVFSIIGASLIILTYLFLPEIRTPSRQILCFLSFCDFVIAVGCLVGVYLDKSSVWCTVQSFFTTFAFMASFFWTVSLAIYLLVAIKSLDILKANRLIVYCHIVSWGVPLICTILPAAFDMLGGTENSPPSGGWCWLKINSTNVTEESEILWMLIAGKFWEISTYIILPILYIMIMRSINQHKRNQNSLADDATVNVMTRMVKKLMAIPIIFLVLYVGSTVHCILYVIKYDIHQFTTFTVTLAFIHSIGNSAQGAVNAVLFFLLTGRVRQTLVALLHKCCVRKYRSNDGLPNRSIYVYRRSDTSTSPVNSEYSPIIDASPSVENYSSVEDGTAKPST